MFKRITAALLIYVMGTGLSGQQFSVKTCPHCHSHIRVEAPVESNAARIVGDELKAASASAKGKRALVDEDGEVAPAGKNRIYEGVVYADRMREYADTYPSGIVPPGFCLFKYHLKTRGANNDLKDMILRIMIYGMEPGDKEIESFYVRGEIAAFREQFQQEPNISPGLKKVDTPKECLDAMNFIKERVAGRSFLLRRDKKNKDARVTLFTRKAMPGGEEKEIVILTVITEKPGEIIVELPDGERKIFSSGKSADTEARANNGQRNWPRDEIVAYFAGHYSEVQSDKEADWREAGYEEAVRQAKREFSHEGGFSRAMSEVSNYNIQHGLKVASDEIGPERLKRKQSSAAAAANGKTKPITKAATEENARNIQRSGKLSQKVRLICCMFKDKTKDSVLGYHFIGIYKTGFLLCTEITINEDKIKTFGQKWINYNDLETLELLSADESSSASAKGERGPRITAEDVFRMIRDEMRIPKDRQLGLNESLDDLGIDSLDRMEIAISIEDVLDCQLPEEIIESWRTVGDVVSIAGAGGVEPQGLRAGVDADIEKVGVGVSVLNSAV